MQGTTHARYAPVQGLSRGMSVLFAISQTGQGRAGIVELSCATRLHRTTVRRLLETLGGRGWRIHAWSYVPGFDHQAQANDAWRLFRQARDNGDTTGALLRIDGGPR